MKNKTIKMSLELPQELYVKLKNSKLRQCCASDNEAVRACIRNSIKLENIPDKNSIIHDRKRA